MIFITGVYHFESDIHVVLSALLFIGSDGRVFKVVEPSCTNPHGVLASLNLTLGCFKDRIGVMIDQKKKRTEASSHLAPCRPT